MKELLDTALHGRRRPETSFFLRHFRVVVLGVKSFLAANHLEQATALTYYTTFAIVPLAALMFGIAKGFALEKLLKTAISEHFAQQKDIVQWIYDFADTTLKYASGGIIAGIGVAALLWTVLRLAGNIEKSFNLIWHVRRGRSIFRKLSDYISVLLVAPILFIIAASITLFARALLAKLDVTDDLIRTVGQPVMVFGLKFLPFLVAWALFCFIYVFVPNTPVRFRSAALGAVLSAILYQSLQMGYMYIQVALYKYNAIYGSFSVLPLFLIWMQWSWLITLLGAEIAYVDQNYDSGQFDGSDAPLSEELRHRIMVAIAAVAVRAFDEGEPPLTAATIAGRTRLPLYRVRECVGDLQDAGVLRRIDDESQNDVSYQPALPPDRLTVGMVLRRAAGTGVGIDVVTREAELAQADKAIELMESAAESSPGNRLLRDL